MRSSPSSSPWTCTTPWSSASRRARAPKGPGAWRSNAEPLPGRPTSPPRLSVPWNGTPGGRSTAGWPSQGHPDRGRHGRGQQRRGHGLAHRRRGSGRSGWTTWSASELVALARELGAGRGLLPRRLSLRWGGASGNCSSRSSCPTLPLCSSFSKGALHGPRLPGVRRPPAGRGSLAAFAARSAAAERQWRQAQTVDDVVAAAAERPGRHSCNLLPGLCDAKDTSCREGALGGPHERLGPTIYGICALPKDAQALCEKGGHRRHELPGGPPRPGAR